MKKVKNNSGATILMALLLILLATAVGAAVLTAAVSAARHLRSDREAQQNYLTVSSAAELIRDSINGQTYERTLTVKREAVRNEDREVIGYKETRTLDIKPNPLFPGPMGAWLSACIENSGDPEKLYANLKGCSDIITVTMDGTPDLKRVQAKFSAEPSTITLEGEVLYISIIRVELSLAPEDGKTEDDCRMTLTMQGTLTPDGPEPPPAEGEYTNIYKTTVKWGSPKIEKGIGTKGAGT